MEICSQFLTIAALLLACSSLATCTRAKGTLSYNPGSKRRFVYFLSKFGMKKDHNLYVYGTVSRTNPNDPILYSSLLTLALVSQKTWDSFYNFAPQGSRYSEEMCDRALKETALSESMLLGDDRCTGNGTRDYLRVLPCDHSDGDFKVCNQPASVGVFNGSDFTYRVATSERTEFFYLFFFTCARNFSASEPCKWGSTEKINVRYNIHLTNSEPGSGNPYSDQFPYDLQGTLSLQLVFALLYLALIATHFTLHSWLCTEKRYRMHTLVRIFCVSLVTEAVFILLELLHSSVYASNGSGVMVLRYFGEVANQFSDWMLILVVILVGKGWQVTTSSVRWSKVTVAIWGAYIFFSAVYFVWMVVSEQVYPLSLSLYHSYQSWAGAVYLLYRLFILVYLLYEMRQVYLIEIRPAALWLYRILAVCYIIWFSYLPLVTTLFLLLNPVNRLLAMSTFYFVFDYLINLGMVVIFCPRWGNKWFQFDSYINVLSRSASFGHKSLKSYGSGASSTSGAI